VGRCHHSMECPWDVEGGHDLHICKVAANILNKQSCTPNKG